MHIKLSDKLVLTSDKHQFILNQVKIATKDKTDKDGNIVHREGDTLLFPFAFYTSLKHVLASVPDRVLMQSDATTLSGLVDEYRNVYEKLLDIGDKK